MSQMGKFSGGLLGIPINNITGDVGGAVPPDVLGNFYLTGTLPILTTGTPLTNTIDISVGSATVAAEGVVELATNAESIAGVDAVRAIAPSSLLAKLGGMTANGIAYGAGTAAAMGWTAAGTDGQLVISATGGIPAVASLISSGGFITFTPGANSLDLNTHGAVAVSFDGDAGTATPALGVLNIIGTVGANITTAGAGSTMSIGVTGTTQFAVQVGNATGSLTSLPVGATNNVLLGNTGANPTWGQVDLTTDVTGILPVANGGTSAATLLDHGVLVGSGVGAITPLAVGTNGMVLLGSTAADPVFAALTSAAGTITYATGAGTLNLEAYGVDQNNIIYVGKHGNDANDGLTINKAFLTIQAAITAAGANDTVWCFDDGTYTENLTGAANVSIYAPNATLSGVHTITDDNTWTFKELLVATATTGVTLNSAGNTAYLNADRMTIAGTGIGILNLAGKIFADVGDITLVNGFFIGSTTADETYLEFDEIAITGTGVAFGALSGGEVQVLGNCVENSGAGNCTVFYTTGGGVPEINATITHIHSDILSNITAGSDVQLNATAMHGALVEAGAGTCVVGGATRIDEVPIGAVTPSTGDFTTITTTTPIGVPYGGSGAATFTDHGVLVASGAGAFSVTAVGATNTVLHGNTGADPTYSAVDMAADVTGILPVPNGGTGVNTLTDHGILLGSGAGAITPLGAATHGQLPIGSTGADPVLATLTEGANITITNAAGSITIASAGGGGGITWNEVVGVSQAAAVDNGYICNNAGLVTVTLPDTAALGSVVAITGKGAGGWAVAQNAGETIYWDEANATTTGVGGSLASTDDYDSVRLICITADTDWGVLSSKGNITIT